MSSPLMVVKSGTLSFGKITIFSDINFSINKGDKVCLVGKNGSGKSTLMKVLNDELELDKGSIYLEPKLKIGYLAQNIDFDINKTVHQYLLSSVQLNEYETAEQKKYLVDIILNKLNLCGSKLMNKMSGGKLRRVELARCLIEEPDILLLDEPTNHLDISAVEWLEEYLTTYRGALLLISHDRTFLNNVTNKTIWIDRSKVHLSDQGFSKFEELQEKIFLKEKVEITKLAKELNKEEIWLNQGISARRKRNQQRLANLIKVRQKLREDKQRNNILNNNINYETVNNAVKSKLIMEAKDVTYQFNDVTPPKIILKKFSLRIMKGEFIGVMGRNGAGKTTFLNLITNKAQPTTGTITLGKKVVISYYDQKRESLDPNKTLWEMLCPGGGDTILVGDKYKHIVAYLKDFLFDSKQVNAKVSTLSGGEQNRLLLAKMLATSGNFLILDEPTNDLDIDTLDMLNEVLSEYNGTLLIVSHDRDFLEKLVTRTIILDGNGNIEDFVGGYQDYLKEKSLLKLNSTKKSKSSKQITTPLPNTNNISKNLSYKFQRELSLLPETILNLTAKIKELESILADTNLYNNNPQLFYDTSQQLVESKAKLDQLETRWLELEEMKNK